jgi:hypothetical protein
VKPKSFQSFKVSGNHPNIVSVVSLLEAVANLAIKYFELFLFNSFSVGWISDYNARFGRWVKIENGSGFNLYESR